MSYRSSMFFRFSMCAILVFSYILAGCVPDSNRFAREIVLYNWEGDIPQSLLDKFTAEYGVKVRYEVYESQEEAIENIRAGKVYDVVIMDSRFIPLLVKDGLLAELDYENISNFKNISPNFRDLIYDPGNIHSVPYSWGVTGLLVRTDLVQDEITSWSDLWEERYAGKVAIWVGQPREVIALALKSLGYSANSENQVELNLAFERLLALKPHLQFVEDYDLETAAPALASNKIVVAMGYSGDYSASKEMGLQVEFVMPEEGALIWGDTYIIPADSPNQNTAELFINFLLRPEISAEIVNQKYYASANQAASTFIDPQILNDPSIYPDEKALSRAEIILPLSGEGQKLYDEIWQKFLEAGSQ